MTGISHIDHLVINTANTERCLAFYTEKLGFRANHANGRVALMRGRQKINVHPAGLKFYPIAANPAIGGIAFELLTDAHAESVGKPVAQTEIINDFYRDDPCGKGALIEDPDANFIRLRPLLSRKDESGAPADMPIDCIYLAVANAAASIRFYVDYLGMEIRDDCPGNLYFRHGRIALLAKDNGLAACGSGDFCLMASEDIGQIHEKLSRLGAPFADDKGIVARTGATGPIRSIYLRDPDGNLVEICRPA